LLQQFSAAFISSPLTSPCRQAFPPRACRATAHPALSALRGVIAGIVTQSTYAVIYLTIGMVSAGMIDKRRALPDWT
jgi:hypothetical protein